MENLDSFIKKKLKMKKMKIETFITKTGMSKSTIYRVMKGLQKPSDELLDIIADILNLSQLEKRELIYYGNMSTSNEKLSYATDAIFQLLYGKNTSEGFQDNIELVFYDKEKYVRYIDDVFGMIEKVSDSKNFECDIKIINCYKEDAVESVLKFIENISTNSSNYKIEHLVSLSQINQSDNINMLKSIIPLLQVNNYTLFYSEDSVAFNKGFFNNFMILDYSYTDEDGKFNNKQFLISLLDENLSSCYALNSDDNLKEFFYRNYESIASGYTLAVDNRKKLNFLGDLIADLEKKYDVFLFKPNPCYNRIPMEVYRSLIDRTPKEDMEILLSSISDIDISGVDSKTALSSLIKYLEDRTNFSKKKKQFDVYTMSGLEEFAKTGMLTDHLNSLPAFTPEEIRAIFESIKSRHLNKKDSFKFYIVTGEYDNKDFVLTAFKNYGLLIEYNDPKCIPDNNPYCIIESKNFGDIFYEFGKMYVPTMITLEEDKAIEYIDSLIEKYC